MVSLANWAAAAAVASSSESEGSMDADVEQNSKAAKTETLPGEIRAMEKNKKPSSKEPMSSSTTQ